MPKCHKSFSKVASTVSMKAISNLWRLLGSLTPLRERSHVPRCANAISSFLLLHKLQVSKCCSGLCIDLLHKVTAPHHLLQNFSKLQFELIIKIAASLKVTWASHMSWPGLRILSLALLRFCNMSLSTLLWWPTSPSSLSPFWLLSYSFHYDQHHDFF